MNSSEYLKETLPNGLRIVTVEMPHLHSVELMCYVGVGGRHEPAELSGISHFLEHMLFRGTAEFPTSRLLEEAFEKIGGAVNASTDSETTVYHARFHPDHVREGAALFASMLLRPLLKEIETERKIILEEALEDLNEKGKDINLDNLTASLLWPDHPLGYPTIGTRETIASIGIDELRSHHRTFYSPGNCVIALAGRVRHEDAVAAIKAEFGGWEGGAFPLPLAAPHLPVQHPEVVWVRDSASQVSIQLAFRLPGRRDPRAVSLRVLRRILSGGGTSRLMQRLREDLGLVYGVEAHLALFDDSGCLSVEFSVIPESLTTAIRELLAVFEELCRIPVGEEELARIVRTFLYDLEFSRDHTDDMATRYGWGELVELVRTVAQDRRDVAAVSPQQLLDAAASLFIPSAMKLAVTGPFRARERKEVENLLRGYLTPSKACS
jgi:predicted Zn-dependent peptidase